MSALIYSIKNRFDFLCTVMDFVRAADEYEDTETTFTEILEKKLTQKQFNALIDYFTKHRLHNLKPYIYKITEDSVIFKNRNDNTLTIKNE